MATQTQNLELLKQDGVEYPSLNMLNINMDKIDEAIGAIGNKGSLQDQIDALGESVSKINITPTQLAKAVKFDSWSTGFQVGVYSDDGFHNGYLANFETDDNTISVWRIVNDVPTKIFSK